MHRQRRWNAVAYSSDWLVVCHVNSCHDSHRMIMIFIAAARLLETGAGPGHTINLSHASECKQVLVD